MYFADLTPYCYDGNEEDDRILNVGWLSRDHDFPRGPVPPDFVAALARLSEAPVKRYRGFHVCEFCPEPKGCIGENGLKTLDANPEIIGNGEIRVSDGGGTTYAAPVLIRHYVSEHRYQPPPAFVEAVLKSQ